MGTEIKDLITCVDCNRAIIDEDGDAVCASNEFLHREIYFLEGVNGAINCGGFVRRERDIDGKLDTKYVLNYMLAGKSDFTILSLKTGDKFKYEILRKRSKYSGEKASKYVYLVSTSIKGTMQYAGTIYLDKNINLFKFTKGNRGKLSVENINIKSLLYIMNKLNKNEEVDTAYIYHSGYCGRCGKKLTSSESLKIGLGPECSNKANEDNEDMDY